MLCSNQLKYAAYSHVHDALLNTRVTIAEATGDPYWGTGLNVQQILQCLPEYWPGANHIG